MKLVNSRRQSCSGQALIEFSLVLPLLLLLIVNVVNFGGLLYAWVTVSNAARTGAQYWQMGYSYAHGSVQPTAAQVSAIVTKDLISLPNRSSAVINVCSNNNSVITCSVAGGSPPSDPEPTYYVTGSVDVTYTYVPFISFWDF